MLQPITMNSLMDASKIIQPFDFLNSLKLFAFSISFILFQRYSLPVSDFRRPQFVGNEFFSNWVLGSSPSLLLELYFHLVSSFSSFQSCTFPVILFYCSTSSFSTKEISFLTDCFFLIILIMFCDFCLLHVSSEFNTPNTFVLSLCFISFLVNHFFSLLVQFMLDKFPFSSQFFFFFFFSSGWNFEAACLFCVVL